MNKYIAILIGSIAVLVLSSQVAAYGGGRYGRQIQWVCDPYNNICYRMYRAERWDPAYRYWWRKNARKKNAHKYKNTEPKHIFMSPPDQIEDSNIININLIHGTWGAYDFEGKLIRSGRVSGGKSYCPDINKSCKTITGTFTIYSKRGPECKSKRFPVGKGGAPMPYCMFFHEGFALHGSNAVPNYNASHGCVRLPPADAQWLNQNFVSIGSTRVNISNEKIETEEHNLLTEIESDLDHP